MTASALSAILAAVALMGPPEFHNRKDLRRARDALMQEQTRFGPILQEMDLVTTSGDVKRVPVAHPFASLWKALTESASFATLFRSRLQINQPTPENKWNIILYSDEVTEDFITKEGAGGCCSEEGFHREEPAGHVDTRLDGQQTSEHGDDPGLVEGLWRGVRP